MANTVIRPHVTDPDGTHDSRYLIVGDPRAIGPEGPEGPEGPRGYKGDKGEPGDPAQATTIRIVVDSAVDLPPSSTMNIGDGALVGATAPRDLWVVVSISGSTGWANAGSITAGPKGDKGDPGDPGPVGPQPPLAGSGSATTAARSDHNHSGVYSPASHTHSASAITSGLLAATYIDDLDAAKVTTGVLHIDRIPDIPVTKLTGTLLSAQVPVLDASKIGGGTLAVDRVPNIPADKVTSGTFPDARIPGLSASKTISGTFSLNRIPGLPASQTTSGKFAKERIPQMSLTELFPNNVTSKSGSSAMRVAPHNTAGSIVTPLGTGWGLHDTGMRQNTDEMWAYVMVPGLGFGWIPENRI